MAARLTLRRDCLAHGTGAGGRKFLAARAQLFHFVGHERAQLMVSLLLGGAMANTAPREKVRAIAHVETVIVLPPDKFEILVLCFHWLALRMALRTCFSW